jgi:hypothetical protein
MTSKEPIITTTITNIIVKPSNYDDLKILVKKGCKEIKGNKHRLLIPEKYTCTHICKTTPGGGFLGMGDSYFNTWTMHPKNKKTRFKLVYYILFS